MSRISNNVSSLKSNFDFFIPRRLLPLFGFGCPDSYRGTRIRSGMLLSIMQLSGLYFRFPRGLPSEKYPEKAEKKKDQKI